MVDVNVYSEVSYDLHVIDMFRRTGHVSDKAVKGMIEVGASRSFEELLRVISAGCVVDFMGYPPSLLLRFEKQRLIPVIKPISRTNKLLQEFPFLGEEPFEDDYEEGQTCSATPTRRFDQAVAAGAQALYDSLIEELRDPESTWADPNGIYQLGKIFVEHHIPDTPPGFLRVARDHFLRRLKNGELELSRALHGNPSVFDVTSMQISDAEEAGYQVRYDNSVKQIREGTYGTRNVQTRNCIGDLRVFARLHGFSEAPLDDALREVSVPLFRRALSEVAAGVIDPVWAVVDDFEHGEMPLLIYMACRGYPQSLLTDALAIRDELAGTLNAKIEDLEERVGQAYSPQQEQPAEPAPEPAPKPTVN
ncbi:MAG: hypothetical protein V1659_04740 [Candidatus Woesearchaeota archaeon]